ALPFAIRAANELGVADAFEDEEGSDLTRLAKRLRIAAGPLRRLLHALCRCGVVTQNGTDRFALTDGGRAMRSDHPLSMRHAFSLPDTEIAAWRELEHCVRTSESGFAKAYGESHRSYRA